MFALLVGPNLLLFGVFTFWPLIYNAYLSLTRWDMISPVKTWVGLQNYLNLLGDPSFGKIMLNTVFFTGASVVLTTLLGLGGALLLNEPLRGRNVARTVLFAPVVLSGAAISIVWIYIFDPHYGLIDAVLAWVGATSPHWLTDPAWAMPAVIMVYTWKNLGYSAVILLAGLQAIPKELYEAARVDGAGAYARLLHVTLPGLSPVVYFLAVTNTLSSFQAFDIIKTMPAAPAAPAATQAPATEAPAAPAQAPAAASKVKFTYWGSFSGQLGEAEKTLVTEFNASQQDVEIDYQFQGSYAETAQKLTAAL